ncbi:MAG: chromosomal replication initiator protein DnaA [Acidimicrobiales bacterium]|nr:MAG: chromosomal replication initiator protein DnaA [Acidimicrobiales bacterium]
MVEDAQTLWHRCSEILRSQVSEAVWLASFREVRAERDQNGDLVLITPSSVVRERIESRYMALVKGAFADLGLPSVRVRFEVQPRSEVLLDEIVETRARTDAESTPTEATTTDDVVDDALPSGQQSGVEDFVRRSEASPDLPDGVNPRFTFDAFVIGSGNRFAHAAALTVAEMPARRYNPLFIYGDAGLGKTHLLHAIAHYVHEHYPTYRTLYVSTETLMNEFVDSLRAGTSLVFKRKYREADVLLVDDIQFMEGKEALQEEFFHIFNELHNGNRQIVMSSDRPPDALATLEDRLRSRFKMGLITDIQPPDLETRLAILRKKAELDDVDVPDEVLTLIAENVKDNIRELEGALNRVTAYSSLTGERLSLATAERVLADVLAGNQPQPITPKLILEMTAEMFGFSVDELRGKSRRRPLVTARQVCMYVFRELTDLSYPAIGREFGNRDHTTVMHAVEKVGALMKEKRQIYDQVTELSERIRRSTARRTGQEAGSPKVGRS